MKVWEALQLESGTSNQPLFHTPEHAAVLRAGVNSWSQQALLCPFTESVDRLLCTWNREQIYGLEWSTTKDKAMALLYLIASQKSIIRPK